MTFSCLRPLLTISKTKLSSRFLNTWIILFIVKRTRYKLCFFFIKYSLSFIFSKHSISIMFESILWLITASARILCHWFTHNTRSKFFSHWIRNSCLNRCFVIASICTRSRWNWTILLLFIVNCTHWVSRSFDSLLRNWVLARTNILWRLHHIQCRSFSWTKSPFWSCLLIIGILFIRSSSRYYLSCTIDRSIISRTSSNRIC